MTEGGEDEFLWWQRRGLIAMALAITGYGLIAEPKLLLMTPLLAFVVLIVVGHILRDRRLFRERLRKIAAQSLPDNQS